MKRKTLFWLPLVSLVALMIYRLWDDVPKGDAVKGVVHNPTPPKDLEATDSLLSAMHNVDTDSRGSCSTRKVGVIQILQSADGLEPGDLILYYNKNEVELCDGDRITVELKNDRIAAFLDVGGTRIKYGAFRKKGW